MIEAAAREQTAAAAPLVRKDGPARSSKTLPQVVEALQRRGGATLAALTAASGWRAPVELANLWNAAKKLGFMVAHDAGEGAARRYAISSDAR